jgi:hypothetical protein
MPQHRKTKSVREQSVKKKTRPFGHKPKLNAVQHAVVHR